MGVVKGFWVCQSENEFFTEKTLCNTWISMCNKITICHFSSTARLIHNFQANKTPFMKSFLRDGFRILMSTEQAGSLQSEIPATSVLLLRRNGLRRRSIHVPARWLLKANRIQI